MRRGLDGAPDRSSYDDAVASLCRSKDTSKDLDGRLVPTFVQTTASSVTVTFPPPVADYGATYLTDQDGTIVGFGQASSAADSLALDFDGSPLRLTLHVHLTGACRTVRSAPMSTWRTVLEEWEYMSGGGVTPNSSRWDEPTLQKSAPTLQLLPLLRLIHRNVRRPVPGGVAQGRTNRLCNFSRHDCPTRSRQQMRAALRCL